MKFGCMVYTNGLLQTEKEENNLILESRLITFGLSEKSFIEVSESKTAEIEAPCTSGVRVIYSLTMGLRSFLSYYLCINQND